MQLFYMALMLERDYDEFSDVDIMILLNLDEMELKRYRHQLSER